MWIFRVISLSIWLNSILVQASDQEILGLAELMKDFFSLINTEGVLISDFNSQSKVRIGFISTKTYYSDVQIHISLSD